MHSTHHAKADTDGLIVHTAVESTEAMNTVVIGNDTDLLVLLCYTADVDSCDVFFTIYDCYSVQLNRLTSDHIPHNVMLILMLI